MDEKHKMVVGYCRTGSVDRAQMTRQKKALNELAKKHNLRLLKFYVDTGQSGATLERPALEQLLRDCKAGKVGTVLVTDNDRIARDVCLVAQGLHAFGRYKVRVIVGDEEGLKFFKILLGAVSELRCKCIA